MIVKAADSKAWVYKRVNDGILQSPLSSGSTVSLTNGNRYTGKVVVGDDLGNSALQRLRFWIDTDDDGTWSDETALLDTTTVDDDWSAGYAGLFHGHIASTAAQDFDDVKIGLDLNADLDLDDTADSLVINDDFASNATTLSYDDNGNLTDDGLFKFVYDAWNRLVLVKSRYSGGTTQTTFATYAYDGANRRTSKVVTNNGVEVYPNDGGNTTVNFYYDNQWRIAETRNGSNQTTWQHLWGTQYIDELIWLDKNGDPTIGNDTDPDGTAGEGGESPADHRYFAHQDPSGRLAVLTEYGSGLNGQQSERYIQVERHVTIVLDAGAGGTTYSQSHKSRAGIPLISPPSTFATRRASTSIQSYCHSGSSRTKGCPHCDQFIPGICERKCRQGGSNLLGLTMDIDFFGVCICVCTDHVQSRYRFAASLVAGCVEVHEQVHCHYWWMNEPDEECLARIEEHACFADAADHCASCHCLVYLGDAIADTSCGMCMDAGNRAACKLAQKNANRAVDQGWRELGCQGTRPRKSWMQ